MKVRSIELAKYERCPRWYRKSSVAQLTGDGYLRFQVRQAIHRYLALPPTRRNLREAESMLREGWRSDTRRRQLFADRDQEREYGFLALAMMQRLVTQAGEQGQPFVVGLSTWLPLSPVDQLVSTTDMITMNRDGTVRAVMWYCDLQEAIPLDYDALCAHRTVVKRYQLHTREIAIFDLSTGGGEVLELSRAWLDDVAVRASVQASLLGTEQDYRADPGSHCQYCAADCLFRADQELRPGSS